MKNHAAIFCSGVKMRNDFFIADEDFRVFLPEVYFADFTKSEDDKFNSRQIRGIMTTDGKDRQDEKVIAKGLDFEEFLTHGHFNDNHDQSTSAIVGYPEEAKYYAKIETPNGNREGWLCRGYVLKGTKRADGIWELAKALAPSNKRLGFSIEGKVLRRGNKVIEKAKIRNVAITNCPVNTEATWEVLARSFHNEEVAYKSLMCGAAVGATAKTGGAALGPESLERDGDERSRKKKKALKEVMRSLGMPDEEEVLKAIDHVFELRPQFDDEAVAAFVTHLFHGR